MRHFWDFRARARQSWSPSSAAGVARDGKDGKNAPTEAIGRIIDCGQEAKMEILVDFSIRRMPMWTDSDFDGRTERHRRHRVLQHLSLIHISEPTRLGMISYAVFCLKKKK